MTTTAKMLIIGGALVATLSACIMGGVGMGAYVYLCPRPEAVTLPLTPEQERGRERYLEFIDEANTTVNMFATGPDHLSYQNRLRKLAEARARLPQPPPDGFERLAADADSVTDLLMRGNPDLQHLRARDETTHHIAIENCRNRVMRVRSLVNGMTSDPLLKPK